MSKKIILKNFESFVQIGIHPFEKDKPQKYLITISLKLIDSYRVLNDDISETVDYDALRLSLIELLKKPFNLQETLIQEIFDIIFNLDKRILKAKVSVAKTTVYPDCNSVGLCYKLSKSKWLKEKRASQGSTLEFN